MPDPQHAKKLRLSPSYLPCQHAGFLLGLTLAYMGLSKLTLLAAGFPQLGYLHIQLALVPALFVSQAMETLLRSDDDLVYSLLGIYIYAVSSFETLYFIWTASTAQRHFNTTASEVSAWSAEPRAAEFFIKLLFLNALRLFVLWNTLRLLWHLMEVPSYERLGLSQLIGPPAAAKAKTLVRMGRARVGVFVYSCLVAGSLVLGDLYDSYTAVSLFFPVVMPGMLVLMFFKQHDSMLAGIAILSGATLLELVYVYWLARAMAVPSPLNNPPPLGVSVALLCITAARAVLTGVLARLFWQLARVPFVERVDLDRRKKRR